MNAFPSYTSNYVTYSAADNHVIKINLNKNHMIYC